MRLLSLSLFIICCCSVSARAQTWEIGGFVGGSGYMGDLNPVKPYQVTNLAFGGQVKRNLDGFWSLKLNLMHGQVQADDALSNNEHFQQRNLNFYSPLTEISLQTEFNFFNYVPGVLPGYGTRKFSPYLFAGIGGFAFNPKTKLSDGQVANLQPLQTEGRSYSKYALSIPYGAGIKYNIANNWNLIGEIGYRTAFTDYLDDVSGNYPQGAVFSPTGSENLSDRSVTIPQIGVPGTQRGDLRKRDTYLFTGISLTYTFVSRKCPMF